MEPSLRPARQPAPPLGCRTTQRPRTFSPARVQQKRRFGSLDSATGEEQRQNSRWRSVAFRKTTLPNPRRRRPNEPALPNRRFCCTQPTHGCACVEPAAPPQHLSTESARPHSADGRSSSRKHPRWGPAPCRDVTCTGSGASRRSRSAGAARGCGGGLQ